MRTNKEEGQKGPLLASAVKLFQIYFCMKPVAVDVSGAATFEEAEFELELCVGPRPSLIIARESGISLVCQPLSS